MPTGPTADPVVPLVQDPSRPARPLQEHALPSRTGRRIHLPALGVAAGSTAVVLLLFWFATGTLRSFVGDIVVIVLLVSSLAAFRIGSTVRRLVGVAVFACAVEAWQGLGWITEDSHPLLHLTMGSTADPLDLVAYALGLVAASLAERSYGRVGRQCRVAAGGP